MTMKLDAAQIKRLESLLTAIESGKTNRAIVSEFGIRSLPAISGFICTIVDCGIGVFGGRGSPNLTDEEAEMLAKFRAQKRAS
jgi:hypothetical protein